MKYIITLFFLTTVSFGGFSQNVDAKNNESTHLKAIDKVPVYPGCRGKNNESLKKCMSKKVQKYIQKNYNTSIFKSLGFKSGIQKIFVQFKINKEGKVVNIRVKGSIPEIEIEAIRVINSIPKMKPGIHEGKKVNVLYSLPIIFQLH